MEEEILINHRKNVSSLNYFWKVLNHCPLKAIIGRKYVNRAVIYCGMWIIALVYLICFESDSLAMIAEQVWVLVGSVEVVSRCSNGSYYNADLCKLLQWYEEIIIKPYHVDYRSIMRKNFINQNKTIKSLVR